jgi:hypothetical protein
MIELLFIRFFIIEILTTISDSNIFQNSCDVICLDSAIDYRRLGVYSCGCQALVQVVQIRFCYNCSISVFILTSIHFRFEIRRKCVL